jgi:cell division protein FtsQ
LSATSTLQRSSSAAAPAAGAEGPDAARSARGRIRGAAIVVLAAIAVGGVAWWVTNSPLFDMRTLEVTGATHLSSAQVARLGRLDRRTNVLWLSPGRIARRIEANPWVESVHVSRILPSTLVLRVRERTPIAVVAGRNLLVAPDGTILGPAGRSPGLPRVAVGRPIQAGSRLPGSMPSLVVVRSLSPALRGDVDRVIRGRLGLTLVMRDGVRAVFGDATQPQLKQLVLQALLTWAGTRDVKEVSIDLRTPWSPAMSPDMLHLPPDLLASVAHVPAPEPSPGGSPATGPAASPSGGGSSPSPRPSPSPSASPGR